MISIPRRPTLADCGCLSVAADGPSRKAPAKVFPVSETISLSVTQTSANNVLPTQSDRIESVVSRIDPAVVAFIEHELRGRFVAVTTIKSE